MLILIPNLITALSLYLGICSILLLHHGGDVRLGCWLILSCAFLDGFDGKIARALNVSSQFGKYFDSLADFVGFGLAPVFLGARLVPDRGILFLSVSGIYLSSCLFRLVRFHLSSGQKPPEFFTGLPVTASATFFAILALLFHVHMTFPVLSTIEIALSGLMVSQIPIRRLIY